MNDAIVDDEGRGLKVYAFCQVFCPLACACPFPLLALSPPLLVVGGVLWCAEGTACAWECQFAFALCVSSKCPYHILNDTKSCALGLSVYCLLECLKKEILWSVLTVLLEWNEKLTIYNNF